ncbi:NUDIX domain-containing protein [Frankia sp. CiP3]|uniref:NUDIX domain-containing protein n=1 Tax=Frankia sp. CiP3 TaxID=2880971 RepID=UPI001EF5414C|nr:NUDIX domain-containing protein [Frankia sp. CiP3]
MRAAAGKTPGGAVVTGNDANRTDTDRGAQLPINIHVLMWRADGSVLLGRSGEPDSPWRLPWGELHGGEPAIEAVLRIADDTVSVMAMAAHVWLAHVAHHYYADTGERVGLFFRLTHWRGMPSPGQDPQTNQLQWHHLDALPESLTALDREALARWQDNDMYSELGWNPRVDAVPRLRGIAGFRASS